MLWKEKSRIRNISDAILHVKVRKGLSDKMTFEKCLEAIMRANHSGIRTDIIDRGNRKSKGTGEEAYLAYLRKRNEVSTAGTI